MPNGIYQRGDTLKSMFIIEGIEAGTYNVDIKLLWSKNKDESLQTSTFSINTEEKTEFEFDFNVDASQRLGFYDFEIVFSDGENVLAKFNSKESVYIAGEYEEYFYQDDFVPVKMDVIGRIGKLVPENVTLDYVFESGGLDYGSIDLKVTGGTNESGKARTRLPITYSTYEAKIKVPDSDALLNGFFLYGDNNYNPELSHEIDVEILFRDGKWQVWTTIFNPTHPEFKQDPNLEPNVIFSKATDLWFNPSEDYHTYTINFYEDYISFAVDGKEISRWEGKFDYADMYLYVSTFYTHWLSEEISSEDLEMNVEWVRRKYTP